MTKKIERRIVDANIQVRRSPDGTSVGVRGYAAVFDSVAHGEVIRAGAFNRTIAQKDNIRLLVNHEGVPLASTRAGTLTVGVDGHGEWFEAPELDMSNPDVQRLVSALDRGDIYQCSFAGYFTDVANEDGVANVREVKQVDVSIVTYPWYEDTDAGFLDGGRAVDQTLVAMRSLAPEQRDEVLALLREENTDGTDPAPNDSDPGEADGGSEPRSDEAPQGDMDTDTAGEPRTAGMSLIEARALLGIPAA
jgi:HK97 family phage prohead protease